MILPTEYVNYFENDGLTEGGLTVEPGWFQLWEPDEIEILNQNYQVKEFAPGFLGFGSSGGGELLAFNAEGKIVMIPFIGMSPSEAITVAISWSDFVAKIE
jgi:hypothetical protein